MTVFVNVIVIVISIKLEIGIETVLNGIVLYYSVSCCIVLCCELSRCCVMLSCIVFWCGMLRWFVLYFVVAM